VSDRTLVPKLFGPLQGVRIVSSGTLIAQPFAASLAAEMGAEVIQIERPLTGDATQRLTGLQLPSRRDGAPIATNFIQERRNIFSVTLDLTKPRGRQLFLDLVARSEIWMESSKPGAYDSFGLDDETLLRLHPKLVIVHVSGYGQTGERSYVSRASYDIVGQAFSGTMWQTGFPDPSPPTRAAPWTGDYITALFALWSSLAGLTHARAFGRGQSIDVAQFETMHKLLGGTMIEYFTMGAVRERSGNRALGFQPLNTFQAADGWVVIGAVGQVYPRLLAVIGLDASDPKWQTARTDLESIEGIEFDAILRGWVQDRKVAEIVQLMNEAQVPCSSIMSSAEIASDPHYRARNLHIEWDDEQVGRVKGIGIVPKFSETPGEIFRGSPGIGQDNHRVYGGLLGVPDQELESLAAEGVI
jgi:crotonobetainyl-CoA:carnitine CoA-transferase CaiB-like acyl-CoA transferase